MLYKTKCIFDVYVNILGPVIEIINMKFVHSMLYMECEVHQNMHVRCLYQR